MQYRKEVLVVQFCPWTAPLCPTSTVTTIKSGKFKFTIAVPSTDKSLN